MKGFNELIKESDSQIQNMQNKIKELKAELDTYRNDENGSITITDEDAYAQIWKQIDQIKRNIISIAKSEENYTIKQLCDLTDGIIECYPGTDVIGDFMYDLQLYQEKSSATLYSDGRLIFFMTFKDVVTMCRFFMEFFHYEDKFTGEDNPKDGKWHFYFDAHGDPGTGIENKSITFHLIYNAKGNSIKEIDDAVNNMIARLAKKKKEQESWKK